MHRTVRSQSLPLRCIFSDTSSILSRDPRVKVENAHFCGRKNVKLPKHASVRDAIKANAGKEPPRGNCDNYLRKINLSPVYMSVDVFGGPNIFRRLQLVKPKHAMRSAFMGPWPALVHRRIRPQPWQPQSCSSYYITGSLCSRDLDPSRWLRLRPQPVLRRGTSVPPCQHAVLLFSDTAATIIARTRARRLESNHPQTKQPPSTTATTFSPAPARPAPLRLGTASRFYVRGPRSEIHLKITISRRLRHRFSLMTSNVNWHTGGIEIPRYYSLKESALKRRSLYAKPAV